MRISNGTESRHFCVRNELQTEKITSTYYLQLFSPNCKQGELSHIRFPNSLINLRRPRGPIITIDNIVKDTFYVYGFMKKCTRQKEHFNLFSPLRGDKNNSYFYLSSLTILSVMSGRPPLS